MPWHDKVEHLVSTLSRMDPFSTCLMYRQTKIRTSVRLSLVVAVDLLSTAFLLYKLHLSLL